MQAETLSTEYFPSCSQNFHFCDAVSLCWRWHKSSLVGQVAWCMYTSVSKSVDGEHYEGRASSMSLEFFWSQKRHLDLWFQGANPVCADICAVCGDRATKYRYSHYGNFHDLLIIIFLKYHSKSPNCFSGTTSCFSCRAFYRRSLVKVKKISFFLYDGNKCFACQKK